MKTSPTDSLLLSLYGCCSKPSGWTGVLEELSADLDASFTVAHCVTLEGPQVVHHWTAHNSGFDMSTYRAEISDPKNSRLESRRVRKFASLAPRVGSDDDMFTPDENAVRLAMQQRLGVSGWATRWWASRTSTPIATSRSSCSARRPSRRNFPRRQRKRLFRSCYFVQTVSADGVGRPRPDGRHAGQRASRSLAQFAGALRQPGHVQWMNRRAKFRLSAGGGLQLCNGVLQMNQPSAQSRLSRAMNEAIERAGPRSRHRHAQPGDCNWQCGRWSRPKRTPRRRCSFRLRAKSRKTATSRRMP